ncbi:Os02g0208150, partial [Oryza sativa Japonica Group]
MQKNMSPSGTIFFSVFVSTPRNLGEADPTGSGAAADAAAARRGGREGRSGSAAGRRSGVGVGRWSPSRSGVAATLPRRWRRRCGGAAGWWRWWAAAKGTRRRWLATRPDSMAAAAA